MITLVVIGFPFMYLRSSNPTRSIRTFDNYAVVIGFPFMYLRSSNPTGTGKDSLSG